MAAMAAVEAMEAMEVAGAADGPRPAWLRAWSLQGLCGDPASRARVSIHLTKCISPTGSAHRDPSPLLSQKGKKPTATEATDSLTPARSPQTQVEGPASLRQYQGKTMVIRVRRQCRDRPGPAERLRPGTSCCCIRWGSALWWCTVAGRRSTRRWAALGQRRENSSRACVSRTPRPCRWSAGCWAARCKRDIVTPGGRRRPGDRPDRQGRGPDPRASSSWSTSTTPASNTCGPSRRDPVRWIRRWCVTCKTRASSP